MLILWYNSPWNRSNEEGVMNYIGAIAVYLMIALLATMLWLGDKKYHKLSLLCLFFLGVDLVVTSFIVVATEPPAWLGGNLFLSSLAVNVLFLNGVLCLIVWLFFPVRWCVRFAWRRRHILHTSHTKLVS